MFFFLASYLPDKTDPHPSDPEHVGRGYCEVMQTHCLEMSFCAFISPCARLTQLPENPQINNPTALKMSLAPQSPRSGPNPASSWVPISTRERGIKAVGSVSTLLFLKPSRKNVGAAEEPRFFMFIAFSRSFERAVSDSPAQLPGAGTAPSLRSMGSRTQQGHCQGRHLLPSELLILLKI